MQTVHSLGLGAAASALGILAAKGHQGAFHALRTLMRSGTLMSLAENGNQEAAAAIHILARKDDKEARMAYNVLAKEWP